MVYLKVSESETISDELVYAIKSKQKLFLKGVSVELSVQMRPPSCELEIMWVKKHNCETFIVRFVFYGRFYCPSAMGIVVSA